MRVAVSEYGVSERGRCYQSAYQQAAAGDDAESADSAYFHGLHPATSNAEWRDTQPVRSDPSAETAVDKCVARIAAHGTPSYDSSEAVATQRRSLKHDMQCQRVANRLRLRVRLLIRQC